MADITALRAGLRDRLQTISGLRCYAVMPPKPEPPAAAVALRSAQFDQDLDGNTLYTFDVWLYVNPGDLPRAQSTLDAYLATSGAQSIKAAIENEPSLGGTADYCRVTGWTQGPSLVDTAGTQLLAIALQCEVMS